MFKMKIRLIFRKAQAILFKNKKLVDHLPGAIVEGDKSLVHLDENVMFGGNVILYANEDITIGKNTMIAMNCILHTSTHDHNVHPMNTFRIDRPIKIGNHVWIGVGAIILPGVVIEDFSVIAAGAIVNANVPRGAIVAGNPARIIKYRNHSELSIDFEDFTPSVVKLGVKENTLKHKI